MQSGVVLLFEPKSRYDELGLMLAEQRTEGIQKISTAKVEMDRQQKMVKQNWTGKVQPLTLSLVTTRPDETDSCRQCVLAIQELPERIQAEGTPPWSDCVVFDQVTGVGAG